MVRIFSHSYWWLFQCFWCPFCTFGYIFFILTLYKFGIKKENDKADYEGVKNHYSTYAEYGIILFEVFLLIKLGWIPFK